MMNLICGLILMLGLTGCTTKVTVAEPTIEPVVEPTAEVITYQAPPEPVVEVIPIAPSSFHVWCEGYWRWTGARYVWSRGYWDHRPGYRYHRGGWSHVSGRWHYRPGSWHSHRSTRWHR